MSAVATQEMALESLSEAPRNQQFQRHRVEMLRMPSGVSVSLLSQFSASVGRLRSLAISLMDMRKSFEFENSRRSSATLATTLAELKALSEG